MKNLLAIALTGVLTALLFVGCGVPRKDRGEFNVAVCGTREYFALHVVIDSKLLQATKLTVAPNVITDLTDAPKFVYQSRTENTVTFVHYGKDGEVTIVLTFQDNRVTGKITFPDGASDSLAAIRHSGADLNTDAQRGFVSCMNTLQNNRDSSHDESAAQ